VRQAGPQAAPYNHCPYNLSVELDPSADAKRRDNMPRLAMWMLSLLCLWMGILWWRWLLAHMANANTALGMAVVTAVVFLPIAAFLLLFARLLKS